MDSETMDKLKRKYNKKKLTRARAIKLYCRYECCANQTEDWKNCLLKGCFLWKFRMGREIYTKRNTFKKGMQNPMVSKQQQLNLKEKEKDE